MPVLLALLAATPVAHAASTCPANNVLTTPTADFTIDNANQVVTHLKTGLMWKRCAEGYGGAGCATPTGGATVMDWSAALSAAATPFAGYSDWRLPNQKELRSIVETGCYSPSINETAFPATPSDYFWSSTAYASVPAYAWYVNFGGGFSDFFNKSSLSYVRLVRGGQFFDSFAAQKTNQTIIFGAAPTVMAGGTGTVSATGGASPNPVTFSSTTPGVCTVNSSTGLVTGVSVGTCTIAADQAGNGTYNAAPQMTQSFAVGVQAAATAVPTLSEWGMMLLAGMLGVFGIGAMRRGDAA